MTKKLFGLLGIGAGPMNLAMAVAWQEYARSRTAETEEALFLDRKPEFSWHPGMQLDLSRMQTSFLKDLVSQHNPTSSFTFLNYLRSQGRLDDFINLRELYPSRVEFEDYFRWAAHRLGERVQFGWNVRRITSAAIDNLEQPVFEVHAHHPSLGERKLHAVNISLALGLTPAFPFDVPNGDERVLHSSRFATDVDKVFPDRGHPWDLLLVGAGQSSAELLVELAQRYPNARITVASRGFVYRAADSSSFVNDMFNDSASVEFSRLPPTARAHVLKDLRNSNYAAADEPLVQQIRRMIYDEGVRNVHRIRARSYTEVVAARGTEEAIEVEFRDVLTAEHRRECFSGVICATGFDDASMRGLLATLDARLATATLQVDNDYRLTGLDAHAGGIYMQGYSDSLVDTTIISNLGRRAHRLVCRMRGAHVHS